MRKVLVVAVHPDDETLGAGGSLLKHIANGDEVYWLIVTKASTSLGFTDSFIRAREQQIAAVSAAYGFCQTIELGIPTTQVDQISRSQLVQQVSNVINEVKPEIMYVPFYADAHTDHRVTFEALSSTFKSFRYPFIKRILMMETLSETENAFPAERLSFTPNYFIDTSEYHDKKLAILSLYESEVQQAPFPRSIEVVSALATVRGSFINTHKAEAFSLIKHIES